MKIDLSNLFLTHYENYFKSLVNSEDHVDFERLCNLLFENLYDTMYRVHDCMSEVLVYYVTTCAPNFNTLEEKVENFKINMQNFVCSKHYPQTLFKMENFNDDFIALVERTDIIKKKFNPSITKKMLKNYVIHVIQAFGKKLHEMSMLEDYRKINNNTFYSRYLPALTIELGDINKVQFKRTFEDPHEQMVWDFENCIFNTSNEIDPIFPTTVCDQFDLRYLNGLSTYKLVLLAIFWCNKFTKALQNIIALTLMLSTNKALITGIKRNEVSFKDLDFWFSGIEEDVNSSMYYLFESWKDKFNEKDYSYDKLNLYIPEDLDKIFPLYMILSDSYMLKQLLVFILLELIDDGNIKEIKNYGLVESEMSKNMWLLAFDIPGYNLPLTLHVEREALRYYYTAISKKDKVKFYIGMEDFFDDKTKWSTSLLYPLTERQRNALILSKSTHKSITHLKFIQDGKWSKHMRDENNKPIKKFWKVS